MEAYEVPVTLHIEAQTPEEAVEIAEEWWSDMQAGTVNENVMMIDFPDPSRVVGGE